MKKMSTISFELVGGERGATDRRIHRLDVRLGREQFAGLEAQLLYLMLLDRFASS
jgi:hypothetical protein